MNSKTNFWNLILVSTHLDRIVLVVLLLFWKNRCAPLTSPLANSPPPYQFFRSHISPRYFAWFHSLTLLSMSSPLTNDPNMSDLHHCTVNTIVWSALIQRRISFIPHPPPSPHPYFYHSYLSLFLYTLTLFILSLTLYLSLLPL